MTPRPPALLTAAASDPPHTSAIGAHTIGCSISNLWVNRVLIKSTSLAARHYCILRGLCTAARWVGNRQLVAYDGAIDEQQACWSGACHGVDAKQTVRPRFAPGTFRKGARFRGGCT